MTKTETKSVKEQVEEYGTSCGFSFEELLESKDMSPAEKSDAERLRVEGIRRRWARRNTNSQIKRDFEFLLSALQNRVEGTRKIMAALQQEKHANAQLIARAKRQQQENAEKKIIVGTEAQLNGELRRLITPRR